MATETKEQRLTTQLQEVKANLNAAERQARDFGSRATAAEKRLGTVDSLEAENKALKAQNGELSSQLSTAQAEISRLRSGEDAAAQVIEDAKALKRLLGRV
jgi:chaperonin cofactor prefoldin